MSESIKADGEASPPIDATVTTIGGEQVGNFRLERGATILDLKVAIADANGPPTLYQQLEVNGRTEDGEKVVPVDGSSTSVDASLVVSLPRLEPAPMPVWVAVKGSNSYLDDLEVRTRATEQAAPSDGFETESYNSSDLTCVGLDSDSGLVVLPTPLSQKVLVLCEGGEHQSFTMPLAQEDVTKLRAVVGIHAMQLVSHTWKLPSVGFAIALVRTADEGGKKPQKGKGRAKGEGEGKGEGRLSLVKFELTPGFFRCVPLCGGADVNVEAACLDRSSSAPRAISAESHAGRGSFVVARGLRGESAGEVAELFSLAWRKQAGPVSSIAWAAAARAVLVTRVGSHAIFVYREMANGWSLATMIGDPDSRGCGEGPADEARFWFPGGSCPLVPGPANTPYIHSGGVLMRLSPSLDVVHKDASVREELWLTDDDEGTPEFPDVAPIVGVHQDKMYRLVTRTDYREEVLLRRLTATGALRQSRSQIRRVAPELWPHIRADTRKSEEWEERRSESPAVLADWYHEHDRDEWDGNGRSLIEAVDLLSSS